MEPEEIYTLGMYTRHVADRIGLQDWNLKVTVDLDPDDDEKFAEVKLTESQTAHIKYHPDLIDQTPEEQRLIVVHELVHCHLSRVQQSAEAVEDHLGELVGGIWLTEWKRNLEYAVDALADVIAQDQLLIDWPDQAGVHQLHEAD